MNRCFLLLMLLAQVSTVLAQTPVTSGKLTLDQCITYALDNNTNLKNARLDEKIADARVKETRGIGLPQVDASIGVRHNQKLPRFFAQYAVAQGFGGTNPDTGEPNLQIDGVEPTDIVASQNFFQLKSGGDAGLTISQLLFNSSYLVGLQAANAYRDLAVKSLDASRETTIQNVSKAFYSVLINKDRIGLFEANITRVDSLLKTTTALSKMARRAF